ncbi:unnamed protein product [Pocillopora meandrina]|uniref:Uncharacterized protein n=1 Tax=Pocillopora meandrina TaxID=46732 RepID=A0AAU9VL58_9CNID|nr:unnamed protein product [Pocillopora meandrina]
MHYDVAVDFVHTGCFPDQLNLGSRLISTAELYERAFFLSSIENERNTFDRLLGRYKKETVSNQKVLSIGIYRLSHGESFESAGVAMNVGKTKEIEAFMDVVDGLCELRNDYINCCILFGDEWEEEDENNDHDQRDNDEIPLDGDNIREILEAYLSSISYGI